MSTDTTSDHIFQSNRDISNSSIQDDSQHNYYTVSEHADKIDSFGNYILITESSPYVYAKRLLREDNSLKYMIKIDTRGKLYNPLSIYGQEKNNNFLDKTCKDSKFKTVNFRTFEMYVKFLSTKNLSWLHNAEREAE